MKKVLIICLLVLCFTACDTQTVDHPSIEENTNITAETTTGTSQVMERWTKESIQDFVNLTGKISDSFNFTFGDTVHDVVAELGGQTSDPSKPADYVVDYDFYTEYGNVVVIYDWFPDSDLRERVHGFLLQNGCKYFGLEVGKSTPYDVRELFDIGQTSPDDFWREGGDWEDPPPVDERFQAGHDILGKYRVVFYFTDDILSTIYIYNPDR